MKIDIGQLKEKYLKKTRVDIIDVDEMRVIIPVLLRQIAALENRLKETDEKLEQLISKRPSLERKGCHGKAEWVLRYDTETNRIYIKLGGVLDAKSAKIVSNTIVSLISYTQKKFDVINDLLDFQAISDLRVLFHLKKVRFNLRQSDVRKVVQIINKENKVVLKIFGENVVDEFGADVYVVDSYEEAEKILDSNQNLLKV